VRDARDEGRNISVNVKRDDEEHVGLVVRDNGAGIPREDLEKVFSPFFTTKASGMCFPICKSIIEAHTREIWAANEPSGWTTVGFRLPPNESKSKVRENKTF